jgi:hypothetical protein
MNNSHTKWVSPLVESARAKYESDYDRAAVRIRLALGAYDHLATLYFQETGVQTSGASFRKWFRDRSTPLPVAIVLLRLLRRQKDFSVSLLDFFPYLEQALAEEGGALDVESDAAEDPLS